MSPSIHATTALPPTELQAGIKRLESVLGIIFTAFPGMQKTSDPSVKRYILFLCAQAHASNASEAWRLVFCAEEIAQTLGWRMS